MSTTLLLCMSDAVLLMYLFIAITASVLGLMYSAFWSYDDVQRYGVASTSRCLLRAADEEAHALEEERLQRRVKELDDVIADQLRSLRRHMQDDDDEVNGDGDGVTAVDVGDSGRRFVSSMLWRRCHHVVVAGGGSAVVDDLVSMEEGKESRSYAEECSPMFSVNSSGGSLDSHSSSDSDGDSDGRGRGRVSAGSDRFSRQPITMDGNQTQSK